MSSHPSPGREFLRQARSLLNSIGEGAPADRPLVFDRDGRRYVVIDSGYLPAGRSIDEFLLVRGDFSCGANCRFQKAMHVGGGCEIGKGSTLEAIAADGAVTLGPAVQVRDWVNSGGRLEIRPGARIGSTAASRRSIRLGLKAAALSMYAPDIRTQSEEEETLKLEPLHVTELSAPGNERRLPRAAIPGLDLTKLHPLGAETWYYDGDLHLAAPMLLRSHLVTKGYFTCQAGSLLEGDVRAGSALYIGEHSLSKANLSADGDLVLETAAVFQGDLHSRQRIRLCTGVRGLRSSGPVEVKAAGTLLVEEGVIVRGHLVSSDRVELVSSQRHALPRQILAGGGW